MNLPRRINQAKNNVNREIRALERRIAGVTREAARAKVKQRKKQSR